jgi:hypothetical protein
LPTVAELAQQELDKRRVQQVSAFQSSYNPFNPNFRATVGSKLRELIDDSGIGGGYKQGLINAGNTIEAGIDFTPIVGDAVGVGDIRTSYNQGDMLGTGINTIAAAVGALPIIGDVAAKGVKSALRGLDMNPEARMQRANEQQFLPETVYHGTAGDIRSFEPETYGGSVTKANSAKMGTWFSDNPSVSAGYARMAAEDAPVQRLIDQSNEAGRRGDFNTQERLISEAEELELGGSLINSGGQNVMPMRVRGNLFEVDVEGATMSDLDDSQLYKWAQEAKGQGFDGLKIKNFSDNADYGTYTPATHYLIFDPKNIRSTNAEFDPAKADSADLLSSVETTSALRGIA